jgi:hypothetical protein
MNSVTASATFDIGRFLAGNVGITPTRPNMLPTFPTKRRILCFKLKSSDEQLRPIEDDAI